jgi:hypothetical protein
MKKARVRWTQGAAPRSGHEWKHGLEVGKFAEGALPAGFDLTESGISPKGVIVADYVRAGDVKTGLVFNALVHQYLIPGAQVGAKVRIDKKTSAVGDIRVASRLVLPYPDGGCLDCHQLISPERLRQEALSEDERKAQRYVDEEDIKEPNVITVNVLSAAQVVNDLMTMFTGLYEDTTPLKHQLGFVRERSINRIEPIANELCLDCGDSSRSRRAEEIDAGSPVENLKSCTGHFGEVGRLLRGRPFWGRCVRN